MADESAEHKTLLAVDGDASGAKRAAQETQDALGQVEQAQDKSAKTTQDTTQKTTEQLDKQSKATRDGAAAADDIAKSMGTSGRQTAALGQAIGRLNPRLGGLVSMAAKVKGAVASMFSPFGAAAAGVIALFGVVIGRMNAAAEATERFRRSQERLKETVVARETDVARAMAALGRDSTRAIQGAEDVSKQAEARGFEPSAARTVAAAVVSDKGELTVSAADLDKLIAYVELGHGTLGGASAREREHAMREAMGRIRHHADFYERAANAIAYPRRMEHQRAVGGDLATIKRFLQESEGLGGEELAKAARQLQTLAKGQRIEFRDPGTLGSLPEWLPLLPGVESLGREVGEWTGVTQERLTAAQRYEEFRHWATRGLRDEAEARRLMPASPLEAPASSPTSPPPPMGMFDFGRPPAAPVTPGQSFGSGGRFRGHGGGASWDEEPAEPVVMNFFNHGIQYMGLPPRARSKSRIQSA